MTKFYIMCGLAFSGKSTLAKEIASYTKSNLIAFDKIWVEEDAKQKVPKNAEGWRYIRNVARERILFLLKSGISVVYDDNNPKKEHRDELRKVAEEAGANATVIYLDAPLEIIRSREEANKISQKRHEVEVENFEKVMKDMEIPGKDENVFIFTPDMSIKKFLKKFDELGQN